MFCYFHLGCTGASNTMKIYAKDEGNNTYSLVNENGHEVNADGTLAYSPRIFDGKAEDSGYPVWEEK